MPSWLGELLVFTVGPVIILGALRLPWDILSALVRFLRR